MQDRDRELLQRFEVQKFLGKGSYGSVYRVRRLSDGKIYALKETNVKQMSQQDRADAVNEIRLLASVRHEHVVNYHEAFVDGNRLCIVMEYAPHGDIAKAIKKRQQQGKFFSEDSIWSYLIQVASGLQALHAQRILHRDIKAANVLRCEGDKVKIGDLGVAKLLKGQMTKTQIGTPHYMPPEVWKNRPYSFSSDTWALGCLLYEMATFTVPFEARSLEELRYRVLRGKYNPLPENYSQDLHNLVRVMLDPEPSNRPSITQVMELPAVKSRLGLVEKGRTPPSTAASVLLETIKVPRNLRLLGKRLPEPRYPGEVVDDGVASWPPPGPPATRLPVIASAASTSASSPSHLGRPSGFSKPDPLKLPRIGGEEAPPPKNSGVPPPVMGAHAHFGKPGQVHYQPAGGRPPYGNPYGPPPYGNPYQAQQPPQAGKPPSNPYNHPPYGRAHMYANPHAVPNRQGKGFAGQMHPQPRGQSRSRLQKEISVPPQRRGVAKYA